MSPTSRNGGRTRRFASRPLRIRWGDGSMIVFTPGGFDGDSPVIPIVTSVWSQVDGPAEGGGREGLRRPFFVNAA